MSQKHQKYPTTRAHSIWPLNNKNYLTSTQLILKATVYTCQQCDNQQLDTPGTPQWAIVGRSNVGKSSLLNCLASAHKLARISSTPGKTHSLNFYLVTNKITNNIMYLVDLPGYGYAAVSKKEREHWARLAGHYLTTSRDLIGIILVLDNRLSPQALDLKLIDEIQPICTISLLPVLTKSDKCTQVERNRRQKEWAELLPACPPPLLFSSKTGLGRDALWQQLLTRTTSKFVTLLVEESTTVTTSVAMASNTPAVASMASLPKLTIE